MLNLDPDFFNIPEMKPEQELAVAVIHQAFIDIEEYFRTRERKPQNNNQKVARHYSKMAAKDAASFLIYGNCLDVWTSLAGINMDLAGIARKKFPHINELLH